MKLIKSYLQRYRSNLILLAAFTLIFCSVFVLSDLPLTAVGYALILYAVFAAVFFSVDIYLYYRRLNSLRQSKAALPETLENFPLPADLGEQLYQDMLAEVHSAYEQNILESARRENTMLEYYTMWVHQIKTPISAMRLLIQSSRNEISPELEHEIFRIEQYVEMALGYQRMCSGSSDLVIRRYRLDELVRKSIRKYSKQFIRKKLRLEYIPTDLTVLTDEKWLCFVIEQVLSNSLKYTNTGSITICTEGTVLKISDTGIGIAPEDMPRIFEFGFTGYNGRAEKKSTGIGLYLCNQICRKLGHGISIQADIGKGACVSIDLSEKHLETE